MPKKCIICGKEAKFCIKNSSEYYCEECAKEHFSDLELLQKIEERALSLKHFIDDIDNPDIKKAPQEIEEGIINKSSGKGTNQVEEKKKPKKTINKK